MEINHKTVSEFPPLSRDNGMNDNALMSPSNTNKNILAGEISAHGTDESDKQGASGARLSYLLRTTSGGRCFTIDKKKELGLLSTKNEE